MIDYVLKQQIDYVLRLITSWKKLNFKKKDEYVKPVQTVSDHLVSR